MTRLNRSIRITEDTQHRLKTDKRFYRDSWNNKIKSNDDLINEALNALAYKVRLKYKEPIV